MDPAVIRLRQCIFRSGGNTGAERHRESLTVLRAATDWSGPTRAPILIPRCRTRTWALWGVGSFSAMRTAPTETSGGRARSGACEVGRYLLPSPTIRWPSDETQIWQAEIAVEMVGVCGRCLRGKLPVSLERLRHGRPIGLRPTVIRACSVNLTASGGMSRPSRARASGRRPRFWLRSSGRPTDRWRKAGPAIYLPFEGCTI